MMGRLKMVVLLSAWMLCGMACKENIQEPGIGDTIEVDAKDYPDAVGQLLITHCAVSGCHDESSYEAAGNLNLSTWSDLMEGAGSNAAVVPYKADFSTLVFFTNTYDDLGPQLVPTMPFGKPALSKSDVILLRDWIVSGAPNKLGEVAFSSDQNRKKYYVINTLCDQVAVFDAETGLIMRYVEVGNGSEAGSPFSITTSSDGQYWMVLYSSGEWYRYRAHNDEPAGQLQLKSGIWRRAKFSADGSKALLVDWQGRTDWTGGRLALIDLHQFKVDRYYEAPIDSFFFPLGLEITPDFKTAWLTAYNSNFIYKLTFNEQMELVSNNKIILDEGASLQYSGSPFKASEITLTPNGAHYMVLCEKTEEVRVFDKQTDALVKVIKIGALPQEILIASSNNLALVSCTEDEASFTQGKGSVWVLDLNNFSVVKTLYMGYQPRGLALDEERGRVLVANRNADPVGADRPHHYTDCEGNNGYVTAIDLQTLERVKNYKAEVSVDPYDIAFRN